MILIYLHPEQETGYDPNQLISKTRHRTWSQSSYTQNSTKDMILIYLHPELDTGRNPNPFIFRMTQDTIPNNLHPSLPSHDPNVLRPPFIFAKSQFATPTCHPHATFVLNISCRRQTVFFYWASPPSCLTHSGQTPSPWIALRMATWSYHHKPTRKKHGIRTSDPSIQAPPDRITTWLQPAMPWLQHTACLACATSLRNTTVPGSDDI